MNGMLTFDVKKKPSFAEWYYKKGGYAADGKSYADTGILSPSLVTACAYEAGALYAAALQKLVVV